MASEDWIVNSRDGKEWALVKRLIFNCTSKQISFVDVVILHTGAIARLPWNSFEMRGEGLTLTLTMRGEAKVDVKGIETHEEEMGQLASMDIWP